MDKLGDKKKLKEREAEVKDETLFIFNGGTIAM